MLEEAKAGDRCMQKAIMEINKELITFPGSRALLTEGLFLPLDPCLGAIPSNGPFS